MVKRNPLEEYQQTKEAAKSKRREEELALWKTWKKSKKPEHLEPLLKAYEPVVNAAMYKWKAKTIPPTAMKAEIQKHIIKAFDSYDPKRGAALNTHVHIRIQKAMLYNTKHQNFAYIPPGQTKLITPITRAQEELKEEYGRDPTASELESHMRATGGKEFQNITAKRIETVLKAQRRDVPSSAFESDPTEHFPGFEAQQIEVASQILPQIFPNKPEMHTLFNHVFGTNGFTQIKETGKLAKKMGKTDQNIAHMKTQMGNTLRQHMGLDPEEEED